jgi:hypothetical protein
MAEFRQTGAIDIVFEIKTAMPLEAFSDPLAKRLQSDLGLSVEERHGEKIDDFSSITSVAPFRFVASP